MRKLLLASVLVLPLTACSMGGLMSAEPNYFQDWSCAKQNGICARTDTIDDITIEGIGGDPALAGPVSGYPSDGPYQRPTERYLDGIEIPEHQDLREEEGGDDLSDLFVRADYFLDNRDPEEVLLAEFLAFSTSRAKESISRNDEGADFDPDVDEQNQTTIDLNNAQLAALKNKRPSYVTRRVVTRTIVQKNSTKTAQHVPIRSYSDPVPTQANVVELEPSILIKTSGEDSAPVNLQANRSPRPKPAIIIEPTQSIDDTAVETNDFTVQIPARKPGKVMPIRMSAFVDANGVYHEATTIWIEVERSSWATE